MKSSKSRPEKRRAAGGSRLSYLCLLFRAFACCFALGAASAKQRANARNTEHESLRSILLSVTITSELVLPGDPEVIACRGGGLLHSSNCSSFSPSSAY